MHEVVKNQSLSIGIKNGKHLCFKYYLIILTLFLSTWFTSNIAAIKFVSFYGITFTGGFIIFPFTTIFSSIIVDVYGYKSARQAIWCGIIFFIIFIAYTSIINLIPESPYFKLHNELQSIFFPEVRILLASIISYWLADFTNSYLMSIMKMSGKSLLNRIIFSYIFSFWVDITCFMLFAFYGVLPTQALFKLAIAAYIKKFLLQIFLLPLTLYLIKRIKLLEGFEIYDYNTNFNPFSFDNIYKLDYATK